jgi:Domain of unknown function (DUF397)
MLYRTPNQRCEKMRAVNKPDAELFGADPETASWRKSSRCAHGDCVEVGSRPTVPAATVPAATVAVRDTKHHGAGPSLVFTPDAWRSFVAGVNHGRAAD